MKKIGLQEIKKLKGFPSCISELDGIHNRFDYGIVVNAVLEFKNLQIFLDNTELRNAKDIAIKDTATEIIKRRHGETEGYIDINQYAIVREGQLYNKYFDRIRNGISTLGECVDDILYAIISQDDYNKVSILGKYYGKVGSKYTLEAFSDSADVATQIAEYLMATEKHNNIIISVVERDRNFINQNSEMGN